MSSQRLRRSARVNIKTSTYNVGDLIEYKRRSRSGQGRLVYRLTEGDSPNPLWLVTFDDKSATNDEIYEKYFTKLVKRGDAMNTDKKEGLQERRKGNRGASSAGSDRGTGNKNGGEKVITKNDQVKDKTKDLTSSSSDAEASGNADAEPGMAESNANGGGGCPEKATSDSSSLRGRAGRLAARESAREQRSRRRQATIDEDKLLGVEKIFGKKRAVASAARIPDHNKKAKMNQADEEVMLKTGTLYLYRGLNRRAVFVRRS